jgi:hypothetical protein
MLPNPSDFWNLEDFDSSDATSEFNKSRMFDSTGVLIKR